MFDVKLVSMDLTLIKNITDLTYPTDQTDLLMIAEFNISGQVFKRLVKPLLK